MTRDELLALGLTDEQAGAVAEGFEALNAQVAQLNAWLELAKQTEVENAELTAKLAAMEAELSLRDKRDAVLSELPSFHPRDARILMRLIDLEKIGIGEGGITGLQEQVQELKACAPYLFLDSPDPVGGTAAHGMNPTHFDMNTFLRGDN